MEVQHNNNNKKRHECILVHNIFSTILCPKGQRQALLRFMTVMQNLTVSSRAASGAISHFVFQSKKHIRVTKTNVTEQHHVYIISK